MMRALAAVLVLCLSLPARALDCSQQPDPVPGEAITESQLQCLQIAIVTLRYQRDAEHIEAVKQAQLAAACEATASIACPKPEVPVVPFLAGVGVGGALVAIVALVVVLAPR